MLHSFVIGNRSFDDDVLITPFGHDCDLHHHLPFVASYLLLRQASQQPRPSSALAKQSYQDWNFLRNYQDWNYQDCSSCKAELSRGGSDRWNLLTTDFDDDARR